MYIILSYNSEVLYGLIHSQNTKGTQLTIIKTDAIGHLFLPF